MSDTEEVVLPRNRAVPAVKNTKPEVARQKLKEKRERLKKEKEMALVEEAKKQLLAEEEAKKLAAEKEAEAKKADPMFLMSEQMKQMMEIMKASMAVRGPVGNEEEAVSQPKRKPRAKKVVLPAEPEPEPEPPKPTRKPRQVKPKVPKPARKPRQIVYEEDSPSNVFVGNDYDAPPMPEVYEPPPTNHLLSQMMNRRNMNSWNY